MWYNIAILILYVIGCRRNCMINNVSNMEAKALVAESITTTAACLAAGEYIKLEENHIIANKQLTISFTTDEFIADDVLRIGHGEEVYCATYAEITATHVYIYEYLTEEKLLVQREHGLKICGNVSVAIDVGYSSVKITICTPNGVYQSGLIDRCWSGRNGEIFAVSKARDITDVTLRWNCSDYCKDIWLFGDSYFNPRSPYRWPSYLYDNGYTQYLLSGFPGRDCHGALLDFKQALKHATPKYAVWCMGMNNEDTKTEINACYLRCADEFLKICNEKGIIPILSTVPNVPERINTFKNDYVRASGRRYVDFAKAVGAEELYSPWYEGMLFKDLVHPDVLGAKALFARFITDFPEIMAR